MGSFCIKKFIFLLIIVLLFWCSHMQTCKARRVGKHWRQSPSASASLYKKKAKKHGPYHHNGKSGQWPHKPHSPKPPPPPAPPAPQPITSPPPQPIASPPPSLAPSPPPLAPPPTQVPPPPASPKIPPSAAPPPLAPPPVREPPLAPPPPLQPPALPPSSRGPKESPPTITPPPKKADNTVYDVLDFGAKGDGTSDDTKAFQAAWAAACKVEASVINVPADYVFLVGPISFSGPYCQHNIVFQLDGKIVAPTSSSPWGSGLLQWLEFTKLVGITIKGSGVIDGNGAVWWEYSPFEDDPTDDQSRLITPINGTLEQSHPPLSWISSSLGGSKMPSIKPTALRFYGSFNVTVTGITIQNSPQCHIKFDNCMGVAVYNLSISSPGDSPNTDGIHLQNSKDVLIRSSNIGCGDDCVSIQTGCTNIYIHNINCGPGHGISIGGLGKDNAKACVSNVTVRDVIMQNTMNGVRIKTWQGGIGSVQGVQFSNIQLSEVQLPIVIDQYYCDKRSCKNQTAAVALSDISYENIRGTYTVKPVHFACSDSLPCTGVTLTNIQLKPQQEQYHMYDPYCWQTFGKLLTPSLPPVECLLVGKPLSSRILGDDDSC